MADDKLNPLNPNPDLAEYNRLEEIKLRQYCMDKSVALTPPGEGGYTTVAQEIYDWITGKQD